MADAGCLNAENFVQIGQPTLDQRSASEQIHASTNKPRTLLHLLTAETGTNRPWGGVVRIVSSWGQAHRRSLVFGPVDFDPFRTKAPYRQSHSARMDAECNGIYPPRPRCVLRLARERKRQ
jgi:hypothetical protein